MACPYFLPAERLGDDPWQRPAWLPLGGGWRGQCTAASVTPEPEILRDCCNLGYPKACPHMPGARSADSVRFGIAGQDGKYVDVIFVTQLAYLPVAHGTLRYDRVGGTWIQPHSNRCIQKMAECYLEAYLSRRAGRL